MIEQIKFKNQKVKMSTSARVVFTIVFILFALYAATLVYPFVWALANSLKSGAIEYFTNPFALPVKPIFQNYPDAFRLLSVNGVGFASMVFNSLWFSVGSVAVNMFLVSLCAYTLSKYVFPGQKFLYSLSVFMMMIPLYGTMPAQYRLYGLLGLKNSPLILLTHTGVFGTASFLIIHGYYKNLSSVYMEAARIDGANEFTIYFRIMIPLARPIIASYMLINFIGNWNDYLTPIMYLDKMPTLASGLYTYQTIVERTGNYPLYFAGIYISVIPILILYSLMHKTLVNSMAFGGIKG